MKQSWIKLSLLSLALALLAPVSLLAQKEEKDKEVKEKKDAEQIIITRKGDKNEKVTIEINGDKITVNGKPLDEYKNDEGGVSVRRQKLRELNGLGGLSNWNNNGNNFLNGNGNNFLYNGDENKAMLGVTTDETDQGLEIQTITKESGAAKAGLKKGDVITKIDDAKVEDHDDLTTAIQKHKPGEKVTVTYLRDKKEEKVTAELIKTKNAWETATTNLFNENSNRAMLGVVTEKAEQGVTVQDVTKESAAAKAGLKEGDVITKVDDTKIEDPDDLSEAIQKHKPGEKVTVTYLRDKKEEKTTTELTKWKGVNAFNLKDGQGFKMDMSDMDYNKAMPRIQALPNAKSPYGGWLSTNSGPKLGLSVQDTEDGKGVKVIEVDNESMSEKAGVKKDDVITEVDGKAVNSTDEIAKIIRDSKEKASIMIKLNRGGKTQNIEVKMPRKIKTTDI